MKDDKKYLSYIEISKDNLIHNIKSVRKFINSKTKLAVVVKANAYGHDQNLVASAIDDYVDYFQVDDFHEFSLLKNIVTKPILVLGYVASFELDTAIKNDAILAVYDIVTLKLINKISGRLNKTTKVHIKIDANLGRQGILIDDLDKFIDACRTCKNVCVDGASSHFANIEDTNDQSHAKKQLEVFHSAVTKFKQAGFENIKTHISATSGILVYEKDMPYNSIVRLGIGAYGLWPSQDLKLKYEDELELKPVAKWVTHVAQIKTLPADYTVGYGLTYTTTEPTKIAVIPQGYSDGYDRGFSNNGHVLIGGERCDIIGRIAMNMFVVDVSKLPNIEIEDEVVLLGQQCSEEITAEELAIRIDTINYEIVSRISPLLPRIIK